MVVSYKRESGKYNSDLDSVFLKKTYVCPFMTSGRNIP